MKVGNGTDAEGKVEEARRAWERFVDAVGKGKGIQGTSLNQEERLWVGILGWESGEVSLDLSSCLLAGKAIVKRRWFANLKFLDQRYSAWKPRCDGSEEEF